MITCVQDPGGTRPYAAGRILCEPSGKHFCSSWATVLAAHGCAADGSNCLLAVDIINQDGATIAHNDQLLTIPSKLNVSSVDVDVVVGAENSDGTIAVNVTAVGGAPALFVTLFTRAQGRFSENVVSLAPEIATELLFFQFESQQRDILVETIRVNHLAQFVHHLA